MIFWGSSSYEDQNIRLLRFLLCELSDEDTTNGLSFLHDLVRLAVLLWRLLFRLCAGLGVLSVLGLISVSCVEGDGSPLLPCPLGVP